MNYLTEKQLKTLTATVETVEYLDKEIDAKISQCQLKVSSYLLLFLNSTKDLGIPAHSCEQVDLVTLMGSGSFSITVPLEFANYFTNPNTSNNEESEFAFPLKTREVKARMLVFQENPLSKHIYAEVTLTEVITEKTVVNDSQESVATTNTTIPFRFDKPKWR
ncbi:hypothetical protein [Shewanella frigidimarina]|uniref:Uncharacterized protein n=1 Tax=Shewanella frigidimarina (strain NCIMB 400) TaxID=318167 RepID=Q07ZW5_SHEFN|nr:hypothetical protein [Shewanella frigidimarina]ABI72450.1 hypothetical protein Sfri_2609 [Shewanella frigidimarina NCIMB 400]